MASHCTVSMSKGHSLSQDITVPVCPLCNQPVPTKRGSDPNVSVNEHIANDCQSDKAKKVTPVYSLLVKNCKLHVTGLF